VSESATRRNVELLATAVAIGAVLLPVGGVVVRYVAFLSLSTDNTLELAMGESIGSLAFSGFFAVALSLPYLIGMLILSGAAPLTKQIRVLRPRSNRLARERKHLDEAAARIWMPLDDKLAPLFRRIARWIADVVVAITLIAVVFGYSWPAAIPVGAALFVAGFALPWLARRRNGFQVAGVGVLAVLVIGLSAVGAGLAGVIGGSDYVAEYDFKADANLPAGRYVYLAESNGMLVLEGCTTRRLIAVDESSVAHITEVARPHLPRRPNLWEVIVLSRTPIIGYRSKC
jgi:hypothetical protein